MPCTAPANAVCPTGRSLRTSSSDSDRRADFAEARSNRAVARPRPARRRTHRRFLDRLEKGSDDTGEIFIDRVVPEVRRIRAILLIFACSEPTIADVVA